LNCGLSDATGQDAPLKAFIFDLDGTLIDSLADIAESINRMLDARGYPRCEQEVFKQMVGDGMEKLVERALPEQVRERGADQSLRGGVPGALRQALERADAAVSGHRGDAGGAEGRGMKLGVISNKAHRFTLPMTEHFFRHGGV
jgi:phosphoglycolate phosphatase